ncbi:MAG: TetR/AcrR family transcriptional regulator [Desulfosarcina sp.]|nr:TetR/AcrR family transcriptional regulator [Desulfosarcina sp.]MBC2744572.1 TetR/AcrR family transcriptional regulator [Desulfosarcina sp.]MBC2767482.1 TetR/AcrR family transcriptional regulator [Desulfosarcina sp.]
MPSPLEKARKNPDSNKARILAAARRLFGEYGFQGTTTRMIAKEVGIDISTLYYHWGEKADLYEAVITDLNEGIEAQFKIIERKARGKSLADRLDIAIDVMCDYLHETPEVSNLLLLGYFSKSKTEVSLDEKVAGHIANIAIAMGLAIDKQHVTPQAKARIMTLWNSVLNFISGESFFRPILGVDRAAYLDVVKETLKFLLIPAFSGGTSAEGSGAPETR